MTNPIFTQDLFSPADAVDTQIIAFNEVTGLPYDPTAPTTAVSADIGFISAPIIH